LIAREAPSSWLAANADLLPHGGRALDVACGDGGDALYLARAGLSVRAVDRDAARIAVLCDAARRQGLAVQADVLDLESGDPELGREAFDLVLVVHYLHRPLFPRLIGALRPGGLLLYETFTVDQALRGRPTTPAFLLRHGELPDLVAPLRVVRRREGEFDGRMVSAVAAVK
jgi:SAM-dependent methyltransferase